MMGAILSATAELTAPYSGFANWKRMFRSISLQSPFLPGRTTPSWPLLSGMTGVTVHRVTSVLNTPSSPSFLLSAGTDEGSSLKPYLARTSGAIPLRAPSPLKASTMDPGTQNTRLVYVCSRPPQPAVRSALVGQHRPNSGSSCAVQAVTREVLQYGKKAL